MCLSALFEQLTLIAQQGDRTDNVIPVASTDAERIGHLTERSEPGERELVESFLTRNADMVTLVDEAIRQVEQYMPDTGPHLALFSDPDTVDTEVLVCFVRTTEDVEAIEGAYERFRDEWWLDAKKPARGRFRVCLEFV